MQLAKTLSVPIPAVRKPGSVWIELPRPAVRGTEPAGHVRIGYARASTARQSLDTQLDSLTSAGITRIFSEKISTRATTRPELDKAIDLARELRASGVAVTLVVHEHKRLGRGLELAALAEQLKASDVGWIALARVKRRRIASVEAVPARIAVAYLIIWSYCSATMSHRIGRDSAGPRRG